MKTEAASPPIDLSTLDVSRGELYAQDSWRPLFEKLRSEEPVHFCAESFFDPIGR